MVRRGLEAVKTRRLAVGSKMCRIPGSRDRFDGVTSGGATVGQIDPELLEILVCPVTHCPLIEVGGWLYATDPEIGRAHV